MFKEFKKQVQQQFELLAKEELFYVEIDRDKIFEVYLNGFTDPLEKQENNCNCCKSFLRQWGGIVGINSEMKMISIWDFENTSAPEYEEARINLSAYIHSLPITNVFFNPFKNCGTDNNFDSTSNTTWQHFYITLPPKFVKSNVDAMIGKSKESFNMLKRNLEELTIDATETVLELIAQNSLYKGKEFEALLAEYLLIQKRFKDVPSEQKENWLWLHSVKSAQSISRIKNTAIGTLLSNISEGMELEDAVGKYEAIVAPTNYKRTTSLVTKKQTEDARKKLEDMGLLESLNRRFATEADLNINDILFTDKTSTVNEDVFGEMIKEQPVNPKTLSKVEEITIEAFINDVVPTCNTVEILVENTHLNNLVSLVTSNVPETPSLFKWDNPFSWAYTGDIADSMKERVKAAGGKIDGVLRFSIQWNENGKSIIDLDAHAIEPDKTHIYFGSYRKDRHSGETACSGQLDVDMRSPRTIGVENITWSDKRKMKDGEYIFRVHNYSGHKNFDGFRAELEFEGELHEFSVNNAFTGYIDVAIVTLKDGVFSVKSLIQGKSSANSKEKWNVKTNHFHKVDKLMLSPNYWNTSIGNKHYFFLLKDCRADEQPRPFFNEFLKDEFTENRKVFEIVGAKLKVEPSTKQLSGLGFSETQRGHIFVRVEGKFKRTLKVNI